MIFLARIVRLLFWMLAIFWGMRLVRRAVSTMFRGSSGGSLQGSGKATAEAGARLLVRDPVCGVHLAEVLAIPLREGGQLLHFCSTECRDQYLSGGRKLAANG